MSHKERVAGRFTLIRRAGEGTFAEVWVAEDDLAAKPGRQVVLKLFRPSARSAADWPPVRNEVAAGRVISRHPNVLLPHALVKARHFDEIETPCLVFDYLPALNLAEWLQGLEQPASDGLADRLAVMGDVLRGLAHVHACGVVHRDVSFGNVIVVRGARLTARLIDFGAAQTGQTAPDLPESGDRLGDEAGLQPINPPPYDRVQPRSDGYRRDVYAFGTLAYLALTGRHPLTDAWQTMREWSWTGPAQPHASLPRRSMVDLAPWFRDDSRLHRLSNLLRDCVSADPDHRPPSAQPLLERWSSIVR